MSFDVNCCTTNCHSTECLAPCGAVLIAAFLQCALNRRIRPCTFSCRFCLGLVDLLLYNYTSAGDFRVDFHVHVCSHCTIRVDTALQGRRRRCRRCKRGFGSPRIWIPHPKTLADLTLSADLDPPRIWIPPFTLCTIASRMMTSNVGSQIRGHLSADLAPPRIWIPIPKES